MGANIMLPTYAWILRCAQNDNHERAHFSVAIVFLKML
jgi:hypothetical protein